jgi:tetratricopeptide (TPR) repeat protein
MKQYRKSIIFLLLITFLSFLFASTAWAQRGRFKAYVTDEQGNPIAGATIIAENPLSMSGKIEVKTDKKGGFIFKVPDTGVWNLTISADGYHNFIAQVQLSALTKNEEHTFTLKKITAEEVPQASPEDLELYNSAKDLYKNGNYKGALQLYQQFLQNNPDNFLVYKDIGLSLEKLGEYDKALESFQKYLEKRPNDSRVLYEIGQIYIVKNQMDKALEYFEKTIQANPDDPNAYYNVAEVYFSSGNTEKSIEYYNKALEIQPDFADSYFKLGLAYLKLNDEAKAIEYMEKFLKLEPNSDRAELIKNEIKRLKEEQP